MIDLVDLSNRLWDICDFEPSCEDLEPIALELSSIDFRQFIVINFLYHGSTALEYFLLSTYKYWKGFNYSDWKWIYEKISGNSLAEYYMCVISSKLLGIDPKYESTKNVQISTISFTDSKVHSGKPAMFVGNLTGDLRERENNIFLDFDLSIAELEKLHEKLMSQGAKNSVKELGKIEEYKRKSL